MGSLYIFLETWASHRSQIAKALAFDASKGRGIDPSVVHQLAVVTGDISTLVFNSPSCQVSSPKPPCADIPAPIEIQAASPMPGPSQPTSRDVTPMKARQPSPATEPRSHSRAPLQPDLLRARDLLQRVREMPRPSSQEREAMANRIRSSYQKPLTCDEQLLLARLSHRQLGRLPKTNMCSHDRLLVKSLEHLQSNEKSG